MTRGAPGNWLARAWIDAVKSYKQNPLGDFEGHGRDIRVENVGLGAD
jgi:hypothetical protein